MPLADDLEAVRLASTRLLVVLVYRPLRPAVDTLARWMRR